MNTVKILVVSDSHGNNENIRKAIELEKPFDMLVHCGDVEGTLNTFEDDGSYEIRVVRGNCDYGNSLPIEDEFKASFYNVWVTHGNKYNVKYEDDLTQLKEAAKKKRTDIVLFGHSHYAEIVNDKESGIVFVNPGSIGTPRSSAEKATYAVMEITEDYEIIPTIKELKE
jgi:putative phosphoesterase